MHYHPKSAVDSHDPRILRLRLYGICQDEDIRHLYGRCAVVFDGLATVHPQLAEEVHRFMYLDDRSVAQEQAWKRQSVMASDGGPQDQAAILASDFESSKFILLPLALAIQSSRRKNIEKLRASFRAFKGRAKSVLETIASEYIWLFPDVDKWALIRNSEQHQSTVFYEDERRAVFSDADTKLPMDYDELVVFAHHVTTGMWLANDVTTACFLGQIKLSLPSGLPDGDQAEIRAFLAKRLRLSRETRPTAEELAETERRRMELEREIRKHTDVPQEEGAD